MKAVQHFTENIGEKVNIQKCTLNIIKLVESAETKI